MGLYLNQLPQTEVARLKAELAETLIANFCYPRFYDYRVGALRTRPVDRAKRQEVWQYLNAVDFNVWGRVDVDSPDFQRQVERLFIHFVQRNRSFFGEQGRKRMTDVRSLITSRSTTLAEGLRNHLRGQRANPPFGSPHAVSSWVATNVTGRAEVQWEQILNSTMQLQQQLQEVRGEARPAPTSVPATPPVQPVAPSPLAAAARPAPSTGGVPTRRPRTVRSPMPGGNGNGNGNGNGGAVREEEAPAWPAASGRTGKSAEAPLSASFAARENERAQAELAPFPAQSDISPTMPLPLGKVENAASAFQPAPAEASSALTTRPRRGRPEGTQASGPLPRQISQPLSASAALASSPAMPSVVSTTPQQSASVVDSATKSVENGTASTSDEDLVIFEQMRRQLVIWLQVEAVRAGIETGSQNIFQLVDVLRHQDGVDTARLHVVSTLLTMCDQIITAGRATLFDYKQAMMFYLMHTRRVS